MSTPYELSGFIEAFDEWVELESPADDLRRAVLSWIFTRYEGPYEGMKREPTFDNLWFGPVPGTQRGGEVVVCAYWISELDHRVRCDKFATLSTPI